MSRDPREDPPATPQVPDARLLLRALRFAADKHRTQRRKDPEASPYINHPIEVAEVLAGHGGVTDTALLVAALLHDTIEDTETTGAEIEILFGPEVRSLVEEVTDDRSLSREERRALQIERTRTATLRARTLRIADKVCNVRDVRDKPPARWSWHRKKEYVDWTERVVEVCRGCNEGLERLYDEVLRQARERLDEEAARGV